MLHCELGSSTCYMSARSAGEHTKMANSQPIIVVIDDSRASVTMCERAAEPLAVLLVTFESPLEGFEYLQNNETDLILLGNLMRETDGLTLLRMVRALPHHTDTPVVVMSTKDYDQDRSVAKKLGAQDYLVKPLQSQKIRAVIETYIQIAPSA
jgi:PleD family two-component response regulator